MKEHMLLVKQYNRDHGTKITWNDITLKGLKEGLEVPIFEYNGEKTGVSTFSKNLFDVEDMKLIDKGNNNYEIVGKKRTGWDNTDKWNPKPIFEDFSIKFKGYGDISRTLNGWLNVRL